MNLFSLHRNPRLLVTLAAALAQGFSLLWLHTALREEFWPSASPQWLSMLYALSVFAPLTVYLMSEYWRSTQLWLVVGVMAALLVYFGWHFGADVWVRDSSPYDTPPGALVCCSALVVLWLHFIPFLRARLVTGKWRCPYTDLFTAAWQLGLMLAEAALFTGLFWALLTLWAKLFKMLGYEFFDWMFFEPAFAYLFTAVVFAIALYLAGSLERLVTVVREQLLGVLKWLAPVAGLILVLFAPTLLLKLPDLVFQSERAISAAWLLWLLAFAVVLLNAGYQDGRSTAPYPRVIGGCLRVAVPAMLVVAGTALYALFVRVVMYGMTVSRFFALIVALVAMVYAIGYTLAAIRKGPWMQGIARVNVGLAVALMIVLGLTLTPLASPYRLSANSQYARVLAQQGEERQSALSYLRFEAGMYGKRALLRLRSMPGTDAETQEIRERAASMLERDHRWSHAEDFDGRGALANLKVYPSGRTVPPALAQQLREDFDSDELRLFSSGGDDRPLALLIDLNEDSVEECVVFFASRPLLYSLNGGHWSGDLTDLQYMSIGPDELIKALEAGDVKTLPQKWRDLRIGGQTLRFTPGDGPGNGRR